jgi:hypothetical protein
MATADETQTELEEFHRWLGERLAKGKPKFTLDQSLNEFRIYREQRDRLREELREAIERCDRGEVIEWNLEEAEAELMRRLAAKGISE